MKILVSSKRLAEKLNEIDLSKHPIERIFVNSDEIVFVTKNKNISLWCEIFEFEPKVEQRGVRWDWVVKLVNSVSEQSIVLNIITNTVQVIFQY